eukprot:175011-Chlamydomonas_euryale.AAC.2
MDATDDGVPGHSMAGARYWPLPPQCSSWPGLCRPCLQCTPRGRGTAAGASHALSAAWALPARSLFTTCTSGISTETNCRLPHSLSAPSQWLHSASMYVWHCEARKPAPHGAATWPAWCGCLGRGPCWKYFRGRVFRDGSALSLFSSIDHALQVADELKWYATSGSSHFYASPALPTHGGVAVFTDDRPWRACHFFSAILNVPSIAGLSRGCCSLRGRHPRRLNMGDAWSAQALALSQD